MRQDEGSPRCVLAVGAHPDDIDVAAGGTIASWVKKNARVVYCVITDGGAGGSDPAVGRVRMPMVRRCEQRAAASALGVQEVIFLGYEDGALQVTRQLRRDIARVIRQVKPDRVVTLSPERTWTGSVKFNHPDHLAAGTATMAAVYPDARNPFAYPELLAEELEPHIVNEVWLAFAPTVNTVVDISATIDVKIDALTKHASQFGDGGEAMRTTVLRRARDIAARAGLTQESLAEQFYVVRTDEDEATADVSDTELYTEHAESLLI
jgi:LmbE family N-acetylglucosaminyl deacetylase